MLPGMGVASSNMLPGGLGAFVAFLGIHDRCPLYKRFSRLLFADHHEELSGIREATIPHSQDRQPVSAPRNPLASLGLIRVRRADQPLRT